MIPRNMRPILLVEKFAECFRFYRDAMGFRVAWGTEGDSYATFIVCRNYRLSIFDRRQMAKAIGNDASAGAPIIIDRLALTFEVKDIDKVVNKLREKGADFVTSFIDRKDWGIRTIFLRDPDGNLLQLESELAKDQWTPELREAAKLYHPDA